MSGVTLERLQEIARTHGRRYVIGEHSMTGHPVLRYAGNAISARSATTPVVSLVEMEAALHWAWAHGYLEGRASAEAGT